MTRPLPPTVQRNAPPNPVRHRTVLWTDNDEALPPPPPPAGAGPVMPPVSTEFLDQLVQLQILSPSLAESFLDRTRELAADYASRSALGEALVRDGLLTNYQLDRLLAGTTHGLVL